MQDNLCCSKNVVSSRKTTYNWKMGMQMCGEGETEEIMVESWKMRERHVVDYKDMELRRESVVALSWRSK